MKREDLLIEVDELMEILEDENLRIFDASVSDDMYLEGHIPGAVYFDHERFSDPNSSYEITISPEALLAEQIGNAGIDNNSKVVLYACGMLPYAIRAWWVLRYAGHKNVRVLNGGITAWKKAKGPLEQASRKYEPMKFSPRFTPSMFVKKDEVVASLKSDDVAIVNTLPPASFEASHITGSVCVSCMNMMKDMEYLLPNDQLAPQLQEVSQKKRIITYCGGGIAATVNAAVHMMMGYDNVAVYDGSLYEWLSEGLPAEGNGKWEIWKQAA